MVQSKKLLYGAGKGVLVINNPKIKWEVRQMVLESRPFFRSGCYYRVQIAGELHYYFIKYYNMA